MTITKDIRYVGVNDKKLDLFEGQYRVPNGISYNSYVIIDEKIAVMDTVDASFTHEWLDNIQNTLEGRAPDYLVVHHMEPDHSANIMNFAKAYPNARIVASAKAFAMIKNFFGDDLSERQVVVVISHHHVARVPVEHVAVKIKQICHSQILLEHKTSPISDVLSHQSYGVKQITLQV